MRFVFICSILDAIECTLDSARRKDSPVSGEPVYFMGCPDGSCAPCVVRFVAAPVRSVLKGPFAEHLRLKLRLAKETCSLGQITDVWYVNGVAVSFSLLTGFRDMDRVLLERKFLSKNAGLLLSEAEYGQILMTINKPSVPLAVTL